MKKNDQDIIKVVEEEVQEEDEEDTDETYDWRNLEGYWHPCKFFDVYWE